MQNKISLELDENEALLLFELLEREFELTNYGKFEGIARASDAELWALDGIRSELQRNLSVAINSDYDVLLAKAAASIIECRGSPLPRLER